MNEEGTGLGPTLEYYQVAIQAILSIKEMWRIADNNTYFPSPMNSKLSKYNIKEIFKFLGTLAARAILDERVIDLPLSSVFWQLVLGNPVDVDCLTKIDIYASNIIKKLIAYNERVEQEIKLNGE